MSTTTRRWASLFGSPKRTEAARQEARKRRGMRKLFMEPLEDRRLLASVNVDVNGVMTITLGSGEQAFINRYNAADFDVGSTSGAQDLWNTAGTVNAIHVVGGAGTQTVTFEKVAGATDIILPGTAGSAAIQTDGTVENVNINAPIDTTGGGVNGDVSLSGANIDLGANLSTDGGDVSIAASTRVHITAALVTIDTESGDNSSAGSVDFTGTAYVAGSGQGKDLTISTATNGGTGGNITLVDTGQESPSWLNDQSYDSRGNGGNGIIHVNGNLWGDDNGSSDPSSLTLAGLVYLHGSYTFDVGDSGEQAGSIDLANATVSATAANVNLGLVTTANSSNTNPSGNIIGGAFNNAGGNHVHNLSVNTNGVNASDGTITFPQPVTISGDLTSNSGSNGTSIQANLSVGGGTMTGTDIALAGSGTRTLTVATGGTLTIGSVVTGSNGLTKAGPGTLVLSGANTYTGTTNVNGGILEVQNNAALGGTGTVVASGATLRLNGTSLDVTPEPITISGTGVGGTAGAIQNTNTTDALVGPITLAANATIHPDAGWIRIGGTTGTANLTINSANSKGVFLNDTGGGNLNHTGSTTLTGSGQLDLYNARQLTANSTGLFVNGSGSHVRLRGTNNIADTESVTVGAGATFELANGDETIESLSGAVGATVTLGSHTLTTGNNTNTTYSGSIGGTGGLIKTGIGTFTLAGANSYGGTTAINQGALLVNGTNSGTGAVSVGSASGGTLGGIGTIGGTVTVNANGTITGATMTTVGTLAVGGLLFNGGTYHADLLGNTSDTISTAGTVDLQETAQGSFNFTDQGGTASAVNVFTLINNTAASAIVQPPLSGAAEGATVTIDGQTARYTYLGGAGSNDMTLIVDGAVTYTGTGAGEDFQLRRIDNGGNPLLQLLSGVTIGLSGGVITVSGGTVVDSRPFAGVTSYTVDGAGGDDKLVIDYSVTPQLQSKNVTFTGGTGTDALYVSGGTYGKVVYNYTNATDGNIQNFTNPGDATPVSTITYTGLEPITNTGTVTDIVFNLPAGGNVQAILEDDGTTPNTLTRLRSNPVAFEQTDFAEPTGSLTINRGSATDDVTVNALPDFDRDLTIGSGAGPFDQLSLAGAVTLGAGENLTADATTINVTAAVSTATTGAIDLTATRNVRVDALGSLTTAAGGVTLVANSGGAETGAFAGVGLNGNVTTGSGPITVSGTAGGATGYNGVFVGNSTITSTSGAISMTGNGGGDETLLSAGIRLQTSHITTVSSPITLTGVGFNSGNSHSGVVIESTSSVASQGGTISISGTAQAAVDFSDGIFINNSSVTNTGAGTITLNGSSSATGTSSDGVTIASSSVNTVNGAISITGSSVSANASDGVAVTGGGSVISSGSGAITVQGAGLTGVLVDGANSQIKAHDGAVTVVATGNGSGASANSQGVRVTNAGQISTDGTGTVSVTGTGGAGAGNSNSGIVVTGAGSQIHSSGGNVVVTGQGGGSGGSTNDDFGVTVHAGGLISAGGMGTVSVTGTGGNVGGNNQTGVRVNGVGSAITSGGGAVTVIAQGGASGAYGLEVSGGGEISAGGTGTVSVTGTGGAGTGNSNYGIIVTGAGSQIHSSGGNVVVTGQGGGSGGSGFNLGIDVSSGGQITAGGTGTVSVTGTGGGGSGSNNNGVVVDGASSSITTGAGNGSVTITGTAGSGTGQYGVALRNGGAVTTVGGAILIDGKKSSGGLSGDVQLNGPVTSSGANITIRSDRDIVGDANGDISSGPGGGNILMTADQDATGTPNDAGTIQTAGDVTAGTGTVTLSLTDCDGNMTGNVVSASDVIKNGSGALRLSGPANAYTGTTNVNAGTLLINGNLTADTAVVHVNGGGTLGGIGTIGTTAGARDVIVYPGGVLDPGDLNSSCSPLPGILTVNGDVTVQQGGTFRVQLNGLTAGSGYDQLALNGLGNLTGDLTGSGGSTLTIQTSGSIPVGAEYRIIDNDLTDLITTRFQGLPEGAFLTAGGVLMNISYLSGDNDNDVTLTAPGRFDFNGFHGYTADNYVGVSPFQQKTGSNSAGWQTPPPQWFERNYPVNPPYTTSEERLRYDGQATDTLGNPLTFETSVVAGKAYSVCILTGDSLWNHDKQQFQVWDGSTPAPPLTPVDPANLPPNTQVVSTWGGGAPEGGATINNGGGTANPSGTTGFYRWVCFTTASIVDGAPADGIGTLLMRMKDLGGGDPATVILAMDIRPVDTVGQLTITRTSPASGSSPFTALEVDGRTVDSYQGTGAPPGAAITVTVSAGSPAQYAAITPDVDTTMFGGQVTADANGTFTFSVLRPVTLAGSASPEDWTISAQERSGLSRGTATQPYTTPTAAPLRFDFGDYNSAVDTANGFLQVEPRTTYNGTRGYGWTTRVASKTRIDTINPAASTALRRDFNYSRNGIFRIDLAANTQYNIRTYHANPRNGTTPFVQGTFQVWTNTNLPYAAGSSALAATIPAIAAGATEFGNFSVTTGSSGVLFLDFRSLGAFLISGVEISAGVLPGAVPLLAAGDPSDGGAPTISLDMLQPVVTEATARWSDTGLTPAQAATLSNVQFAVADLGGAYLGLANPATNQIRIDDDAARLGWAAGPSAGGVDLLTVVMHEMGHLLGSDHSDDDHDLMAPVLSASPLRAYSFDLRPSSAKRAEAVEPLGQAEWRTGLTPFMFGPSSRASGRSSGVDDVFAQLDRESASLDGESETVSTWLQSAADGLWAARSTRSGEETTQARVPRRSRLPRFERELDAWFAELAAEESGQ